MASKNNGERNIFIRITKVDQFIRFFTLAKEFSVNKFKRLYQKGKELIKFFSDTKNLLILSQFAVKEVIPFSEIQKNLNVSSSLLSYNLKRMTDLGFLEKVQRDQRENNKFSFYKITNLGKSVVSQLFSIVNI